MKHLAFIIALCLLAPLAMTAQTNWKLTSGSVSFKIKNAGVNVSGKFTGMKMNLLFSPDKLGSSSLSGTVEVNTINTGIDKRDKDLKEEKYFNEPAHKQIEIKSVKLYKKGAQYAGLFNVTIKGVTKQVEIPFDFKQTGQDAAFTGSFTINRKDYGIGGSSMILSDNVTVSIDAKAKS